jgi:hypothetical protein
MVTCAGCPYGTFGQRTGIQRSSVASVYGISTLRRNEVFAAQNRERRRPLGERRRCGCHAPYATGAPSSSKKPRVLFGSTGMPGAMVDVKVIFLRYRPLAAAGLSLTTSSSAAT